MLSGSFLNNFLLRAQYSKGQQIHTRHIANVVTARRTHTRRYAFGTFALAISTGLYINHQIFKTDKQAGNWQVKMYTVLPLRILSRVWGRVNSINLPESWREPIYKRYIRMFDVNMDEAAIKDLKHYRNLGEFFRRKLTPSCRQVDLDSCLVSPSDGKVLHFGRLGDGQLEQVKGVTYSLSQFLGPHNWPRSQNQFQYNSSNQCAHTEATYESCIRHTKDKALYYCTVYLAPGDYHGFHSPTEWTVSMRRHFPGELLSVNPGVARWVKGLFNLNERAVYVGEWAHGFFAMAPVGATNVGSINVYHDQKLLTNIRGRIQPGTFQDRIFSTRDIGGIPLKTGESFGEFNLGSSIVLVFEAPQTFQFSVKSGDKIQFGQSLGCNKTETSNENIF